MAEYWVVTETGYLFKSNGVANDDWSVIATELDMLFLDGRTDKLQDGYLMPHEEAAKLTREEREILTLPEIFPYFLSVKTNSTVGTREFKYIVTYLRPDGTPFVNPKIIGSLIKITEDRQYMFNLPQFQIVQAAQVCNEKIKTLSKREDFINTGLATTAQIKEYSASVQAVLDRYTNEMKVVMPDKLSVTIKKNEDGSYRVEPVLLQKKGTESIPLSSDSFEEAFNDDFNKNNRVKGNYLGNDGFMYVVEPALQEGLKEIKKYSHLSEQEAKELAACPAAKFDTPVFDFDLSYYADRVKEIGEFVKKSLPYINPDLGGWLPDEGEALTNTQSILDLMGLTDDYFKTNDFIKEAHNKIIDARNAQQDNVLINGRTIQLGPAFVEFIERKYDAIQKENENKKPIEAVPEGQDENPVKQNGKKVLIIKDNIDELQYTAKKRLEESSQINESNIYSGLSEYIKLYPHQKEGIAWILQCWKDGYKGVLLADDMGLGKTMQALSFISGRKKVNPVYLKKSVLIVAPVSLLRNWQEEIIKFVKPNLFKDIIELYGSEISKYRRNGTLDLQDITEDYIVLTTYETLRTYQLYMGRVEWSVMIIDEAQRIKNPGAMITDAVKAMKYDFAIALSGTPVENTWLDLWSIMDFVVPGKLNSLVEFKNKYQNQLDKLKNKKDELRELGNALKKDLEPVFLRRLKKDYLSALPAKKIYKCPEVMPEKQKEAYEAVIQRVKANQDKIGRKNMLQVIAELRDVSLFSDLAVCSDHALAKMNPSIIINSSARLKKTFQILMNIKAVNEKALIFVTSRKMQRLLVHLIEKVFNIFVETPINGELPSEQRQNYINRFCKAEGFNVLILSPVAAGVGFNITAANHVIHLGRCWNPAKEDQATDRVYRIGQQKDVNIYLPMAVHTAFGEGGTFDEKLDKLLDFKRKLSDSVIYPTGENPEDGYTIYGEIFGTGDVKAGSSTTKKRYWTIDDMSKLDGSMFEKVICDLYNCMEGFSATKTPDSNDHGADVVVYCDTKNRKGLLIQCKQTSTTNLIGKNGVEEVYGAIPMYREMHHYSFKGVVVTNGVGFTTEAKNKAKSCKIKLISRKELSELFKKYPTERNC